jgi:hypothetical protein
VATVNRRPAAPGEPCVALGERHRQSSAEDRHVLTEPTVPAGVAPPAPSTPPSSACHGCASGIPPCSFPLAHRGLGSRWRLSEAALMVDGWPLRPSGPEVSPGPVVTTPGVCYPSESGVTSAIKGRRSVRRVRARARLELPRTSVVPCPLGKPRWRMMVSLPPRVPLRGGARRFWRANVRGEMRSSHLLARWRRRAMRPRLRPAVLRNRLVTYPHCRGRQRLLRTAGWAEGVTSRCPAGLQPAADQIRV